MAYTAEQLAATQQQVADAINAKLWLYGGPAYTAKHLTNGAFKIPKHIKLISNKITECAGQKNKRIIVSTPPRHGKSTLLSQWGPLYYLELFQDRRIIVCANTDTLAMTWGRNTRNAISSYPDKLTVKLSQDSQAVDQWNTTKGGGLKSVGVGSNIIGFGYHMGIIDDPYGSHEEAESKTIRDKVWNWFTGTFYHRAEPGASILIVMARWNDDDLVARILNRKKRGGEDWEYIEIPAISKENDPLGRAPGEALWPERYNLNDLQRIRMGMDSGEGAISGRIFEAQFQQEVIAATGPIFKREWFRYYEDGGDHYILHNPERPDRPRRLLKSDCWRFIMVDTAMKDKTTSDYTVAQVWDVEKETGVMVLVDQWREQATTPVVKGNLRNMNMRYTPIFIGVEDKVSGTAVLQEFQREGLPIRSIAAKEDKRTRAGSAEIWMENGRVHFPLGVPWLADLEKEVLAFTGNKDPHDDQVDVLSNSVIQAKSKDLWKLPPPPKLPPNSIGKILGYDKIFGPQESPHWSYLRRA